MSKSNILNKNAAVRDAVRVIEKTTKRLAVVVDNDGKLLGTITDGDVRRAILADHTLDSLVENVMNENPIVAKNNTSESYLLQLLKENGLESIPLVDSNDKFLRVVHVSDFKKTNVAGGAEGFHSAVIMAGGEGRRLRPFTETVPKPMLKIGGIPLLERIVRSMVDAGVPRIYISTNYLSEQIKSYFGDGSKFGVPISYLHEEFKLGTVGALSLIRREINKPVLVVNGDVLTNSDYRNLIRYHNENEAKITACAVEYRVEIPYGVFELNGSKISSLKEKPSQRFLCNAGIYALAPEVIKLIPKNTYIDMTSLIETVINSGENVYTFPIHEYWTDIGSPADLQRACDEIKILEQI